MTWVGEYSDDVMAQTRADMLGSLRRSVEAYQKTGTMDTEMERIVEDIHENGQTVRLLALAISGVESAMELSEMLFPDRAVCAEADRAASIAAETRADERRIMGDY